ncbi:hypothetical protein AVEN_43906-1 [Araneus ventricosus]|uniref:Uncharacterized protein n=1 Tax=Araneus ventricosus TaxID=182803 RepID=A0A4Y2PJW7_ARAVE|nr:hypothetical protein AVEN_204240-1 [Araneus ventricosus]GBN52321.1 hypothetical protein AVEN_161640-1 [Araneus ventricosus]GBN52738.1 hypothetical protein AVEN_171705-1 [Araneus ventricosus]GBN54283.1 hypothetical protein AVEN_43906-1 [Araneus ventricosus]
MQKVSGSKLAVRISHCNRAVDAISATVILSINCVDTQFYMTSLFSLIEHLGRGNPAHYQEESFGSSSSTIIDLLRFMHCRKQWNNNRQAVRVLCNHQKLRPFRS